MYEKTFKEIFTKLKVNEPVNKCPTIGQIKEEIIFNLKVIKLLQPKTIVEIGSSSGGNVFLMSTVLDSNNHNIISIDPWYEDSKYGPKFKIYKKTIKNLKKEFKNINYHHIRGPAEDPETITKFNNLLEKLDSKIDFLFIDGNHNKDSALNDYNNYKNFVNNTGIICFHDIAGYPGVYSAWKEITSNLDKPHSTKIINIPGIALITEIHGFQELGLGYIWNTNCNKKVTDFLSKN